MARLLPVVLVVLCFAWVAQAEVPPAPPPERDPIDEIVPIPGLGPDALTTHDYAPGSEPVPISAPSLRVSFRVAGPLRKDQPLTGSVLLTNVGTEPVLIPTRWRSSDELYRSEVLALNTHVESIPEIEGEDGCDFFFHDWLYCAPKQGDCRSLAPAEVIELSLRVNDESSYGLTLNRPSDCIRGVITVSLILPHTDQITAPIEAGFQFDPEVVEKQPAGAALIGTGSIVSRSHRDRRP